MKNFLIILIAAFFLAACGGDEQDTAEQKAAAPAPKKEMQPSASTDGKEQKGMKVVDHTMDEIEFELKRALGGVERMIEKYKEEGFDTAELEAKKEKLEKELKDLVSG